MKYGLVVHNYGEKATQAAGYNIGDPIQSIALEKLYKEMKIPQTDIVKVDMCDLMSYRGEKIVLPMLGIALGVGYVQKPLPEQIVPVFISAHFVINDLNDEWVKYLKKYQPIGCRDEYSLSTMKKYNISAYLSGCITVLFDRRKDNSGKKVYLIDAPKSVYEFIPKEIMDRAVEETHLVPLGAGKMSKTESERLYEYSRERIKEYEKDAALIISSRMHALVPAMAMGIPVIPVFENLSFRFSWLDKYIPLYTEERFAEINWNPNIVEYEKEKSKIRDVFIATIRMAADRLVNEEKYAMITEFYQDRERAVYGNKYINQINKLDLDGNSEFSYIIWGCGLIGNITHEILSDKFPKSHMVVAVDEFAEGKWHGVDIIKSQDLDKYSDEFVFISTYSGREQAYSKMNELGKKEFKDYLYLGTING